MKEEIWVKPGQDKRRTEEESILAGEVDDQWKVDTRRLSRGGGKGGLLYFGVVESTPFTFLPTRRHKQKRFLAKT